MSKTLAIQISEELDKKIKLRLLSFGERKTLKSYIIDLIQNDLKNEAHIECAKKSDIKLEEHKEIELLSEVGETSENKKIEVKSENKIEVPTNKEKEGKKEKTKQEENKGKNSIPQKTKTDISEGINLVKSCINEKNNKKAKPKDKEEEEEFE